MSGQLSFVVNPYNNPKSIDHPGAFVKGSWKKGISDELRRHRVKALFLNYARGWDYSDYRFLADLDFIEELHIISTKGEGLNAVAEMESLQRLSITCQTKDRIDLDRIPNLKRCFFTWWDGVSTVFDCENLSALSVDRLRLNDYSRIGSIPNLEELAISNCAVDNMDWVNRLNMLTEIELVNCRQINDFTPISACKKLRRLTLRGCIKLADLKFLKGLRNLEVLVISDNREIASLSPIENLKNLKAVSFAGRLTNITDGDLSYLNLLPKLSMLMFAPRRHYSHKLIRKWNWKNFDRPGVLLSRK